MKLEEFLIKSINKHGLKFDYSRIRKENISSREKVKIICPIHGEFIQISQAHYLSDHGCEKCSYDYRKKMQTGTLEEFIIKANLKHNGFYDYSESKYINDRTKIKIICPTHGAFYQSPNNHYKYACLDCGNISSSKERLSSVDDFIKKSNKIHNNYYSYEFVNFKGVYHKVEIVCPKHGVFSQIPSNHVKGVGCMKCSRSKGEVAISKILDDGKIKYTQEKQLRRSKKSILRFDFFIPSLNLYIEYQGRQHYQLGSWGGARNLKSVQERDNYKRSWCKKNNHNLLEIKYTDYENIDKILNKHILANITSLLT